MNIFRRLRDLTLANLNALIDKAEDPLNMLDQYLHDLADDIEDATQAVAQQMASVKILEKQCLEAEALFKKRQNDAVEALAAGNDDLAKRLLTDKRELERRLSTLKPQLETQQAGSARLLGQLKEMQGEYESLKAKRASLVARAHMAKANQKAAALFGSVNTNSLRCGVQRVEEKIAAMEAHVEISRELSGHSAKSLDQEVDAMVSEAYIDAELAALKATLTSQTN